MTPQEHNKYVGLAQLGYAGFHLLTLTLLMSGEGYLFRNIYRRSQEMGGPPLPSYLVLMFVSAGVVAVAMTVPAIVGGFALLTRRPWAKVAGWSWIGTT